MVVCARLVLVTAALRPSIAIQSCFPQFEGFNRSVFTAAGRLKLGTLPFTSLAPNTVSVDRSGLTSPAPLELLAQVNAEDAAASSETKRIMSISQRSAINERDDGGSRERVTFSFGKNWFQFIKRLTPQIVASAELDLKNWLPGLAGKRVLDVGSGSGLSSLAFLRLGAAEVVSFDYDKYSVAATMRLRENRSQGGGWGGGTWHVFRGCGGLLARALIACTLPSQAARPGSPPCLNRVLPRLRTAVRCSTRLSCGIWDASISFFRGGCCTTPARCTVPLPTLRPSCALMGCSW